MRATTSIRVAAAVLTIGLTCVGWAPAATAAQTPPGSRGTDLVCPSGQVPDAGFSDTAGSTFEDEIDCLAWWGITAGGPEGLPEDQYGPVLDVRRAQMATFLARAVDATDRPLPSYDGTNRFSDVADDSPHAAAINRLAAAGIVSGGANGTSDDEYSPDLLVTRAAMASFLARTAAFVIGSELDETGDYFDDDEEAQPHEANINRLAGVGVLAGRSEGVYAPFDPVRREAMSAFVMRTMDLLAEMGWVQVSVGDYLIALDATEVEPGGTVSGTETGFGGQSESITVSGCGLEGEALALDPDRRFSVTIPGDQQGDCALTFVLTYADGSTLEESHSITVTP